MCSDCFVVILVAKEEPPPKRQRKENYEAEHASRSREVATQGRQNILQDCPEAEENKKNKTDISEAHAYSMFVRSGS